MLFDVMVPGVLEERVAFSDALPAWWSLDRILIGYP